MSKNYPNPIQVNPPNKNQKYKPAKIKIDSVDTTSRNRRKVLVISGRFTNGCSHIQKAGHTLRNDTLSVSITAWQPADKMCTQAMKPFSFFFDKATAKELKQLSSVQINQHYFTLNQ